MLESKLAIVIIVTIDAAGCQKEIVRRIRDRGRDYVIALKSNQGALLAEAENFFSQATDVQYEETGCITFSSREKGHGRADERKIVIVNQLGLVEFETHLTRLFNELSLPLREGYGMDAELAGNLIRSFPPLMTSITALY